MLLHRLILEHGHERAAEMMPDGDRHLLDLAAEILGDDRLTRAYLYSGFAMTALPHRRPVTEQAVWHRVNGRFSLLIEPGYVLLNTGTPKYYGIPYGARARLIMIYLQTQAIRTQSREIHLGATMHDWLLRMGIPVGGTTYAAIREQARRLSACRLTVGWQAENGLSGFERANIVSAAMFLPVDSQQPTLWEETVRLSAEFYQALTEHPVPVNEAAIRLIQNSSSVIDIYIWLCYRMKSISNRTMVSWQALHSQFGCEYRRLAKFKERFIPAFKEALAVYPDAVINLDDRGIMLCPSPPPIPDTRN